MDEIYASILRSALAVEWVQWLAFIFSLAYVVLAAKENVWCWFFGLIGVVLSFVVYVEYGLYSEAILQIYYAVISIYGWWGWQKGARADESLAAENGASTPALQIRIWAPFTHLKAVLLGIGLGMIWGYFWSHFGAALPYIDALITAFSVIATYMVAQKILENWLYWILIDAVCILVYLHREIYLFAILFFIYCIVAIVGYRNWRREYQWSLR